MGGCDQCELELGKSCNGVDGSSGIMKDGRIQLEERKRKGIYRRGKHKQKPGRRNLVVPIEVECKIKLFKRNHSGSN